MKIKAAIGSPLYEVKHFYGKPNPVKTIKEGCKKNLLLSITIEEASEDVAYKAYNEILEEIKTIYGAELKSLSECDWAKDQYVEWTLDCNYTNSICIPKDFDNLESQKKLLLKTARDIIRSVKKKYWLPTLKVRDNDMIMMY